MGTTSLLKLTAADRVYLVNYAKARKMPKHQIKEYETGAADGTPLAQLVATIRKDMSGKVTELQAGRDADQLTITSLRQEATCLTARLSDAHHALGHIKLLANSFLVFGRRIRDVAEATLLSNKR